jgi:hypothetical protein
MEQISVAERFSCETDSPSPGFRALCREQAAKKN